VQNEKVIVNFEKFDEEAPSQQFPGKLMMLPETS
jgi:hypothetical protein